MCETGRKRRDRGASPEKDHLLRSAFDRAGGGGRSRRRAHLTGPFQAAESLALTDSTSL